MNNRTTTHITLKGKPYSFTEPEVMGILNVTPDSFYAGSRKQTEAEIAQRTNEIIAEGATMIDVGACSTRPGSEPVSEEEEMTRLRKALKTVRREQPDAILSIDTFRPKVAQMCVEEYGADIINDVSEGTEEMFRTVGKLKVQYILMSVGATLEAMDIMFTEKIEMLQQAGCNDIILDPGYGFGKDISQNFDILKQQEKLLHFNRPILAGISRKRLIWQLLNITPAEALNGTTVVNALALLHGADILRVHDVKQAIETIKIIKACS
jgi:dihydropteroate synthase